jgi:hypothetical protein
MDLKIQVGSIVGKHEQDGWYRQWLVLEIKDNKVILFAGKEIDIDKLEPIFVNFGNDQRLIWIEK